MRGLPLVLLLACLGATARGSTVPATDSRPNVLFIAIDDLRDWVGFLDNGHQARTPNLDRLASMGEAFTRAYCAAPACNPSRAAVFSGLNPSTSGVYNNTIDFRKYLPPDLMLPVVFRHAGYYVQGAGKMYHEAFPRPSDWDNYLTVDDYSPPVPAGQSPGVGGIRFAPLDCQDSDLADWKIVNYGIATLQQKHDRPFFLAIGLHKPHLPWNVPCKYFDLFPLDSIKLPPHRAGDLDDLPETGRRLAQMFHDQDKILQSGRWKQAVQAYLAAIAYTDMNVGRLLDAYEKSPDRDHTIIVLWSDHGWSLGEKSHWRKFALWEEDTRVPLIWRVPGLTRPGSVCTQPVSLMSIYPTLTELCGISTPQHVQGVSLRPLLANPDAPWDHPAVTTLNRGSHAVRTRRWRYIRYADGGEELYNETDDPHEYTNLAGRPELAGVKAELAAWFPQHEAPTPPSDRSTDKHQHPAAARR